MNTKLINKLIEQCLYEDIGSGDITTNSIVPAGADAKGIIHMKQSGIIAGLAVAEAVFHYLSAEISFISKVKDGDKVEKGTIVAVVEGDARAILTGERVALNFLQRMSGIATYTSFLAEKVREYPVRVVDTRKTTPGLRMLEKYAVLAGGGYNHRFGLYDAIMLKDNHIKVAGGITQAIGLAREKVSHMMKIEVEVEDLAGVAEALQGKADVIMLDNMDVATMEQAVALIGSSALVEASGGINEETIVNIARTGVDIISVGALTHSAQSLDISLDIGHIKVGRKQSSV